MEKTIILAIIILLVFTLILAPIPAKTNYVKIIPQHTHSYTKAICTEQNLCQDYQIFCRDLEIVSMSPITGAVIQFPTDWKDPRSEEIRNNLC